MEDVANLITAMSQLLWPMIFVGILFFLRREIRSLIQPGAEFILEMAGGKFIIKPTKPPTDKTKLPPVPKEKRLPADYLFINHTSFFRPQMQAEFQRLTGVTDLKHYDIRVIVDSYYRGALEQVERVEYVLHESYPNPIQVRTKKEDKFLLKEVANGEYVLFAKVFILDRTQPVVLQRYITLWDEGPLIDSAT